jgi:hypothetical protein
MRPASAQARPEGSGVGRVYKNGAPAFIFLQQRAAASTLQESKSHRESGYENSSAFEPNDDLPRWRVGAQPAAIQRYRNLNREIFCCLETDPKTFSFRPGQKMEDAVAQLRKLAEETIGEQLAAGASSSSSIKSSPGGVAGRIGEPIML